MRIENSAGHGGSGGPGSDLVGALASTGPTPGDTNSRRVLRILRYLAGHRPALTAAIVRDCQIPRTSAWRLLQVMADERFILFDPDKKRWGLGPSSYELGSGYRLADSLVRQSGSVLVRLAAQTGARMALGVLDGTDVIMVALQQPHPGTADAAEVGIRYPAHLTATGRALLVHRSRGDLIALYGNGPLARPTGRGPGTVDELLDALRKVEAQGYAESAEDLADGIWAFAAPVRSAAHRVVGALGAGFLGCPPDGPAVQQATAELTSAAAQVSARLGYHPD